MSDESIEAVMDQPLSMSQARFGDAIQYAWFYDRGNCPGYGGMIDAFKHKGEDAISLNTFIYRQRHVLIGYFLCPACAQAVFRAAERHPGIPSSRHAVIESNLIKAYHKHLHSLDA